MTMRHLGVTVSDHIRLCLCVFVPVTPIFTFSLRIKDYMLVHALKKISEVLRGLRKSFVTRWRRSTGTKMKTRLFFFI